MRDAATAIETGRLASIRPPRRSDLPALRAVVEANALFPADLLDGMLADYLAAPDQCAEIWRTLDEATPSAIAYCAPERMTSGTWNLLLIAVHPARHRRGVGAAFVRHVEAELRARGARMLLVETSGLPTFESARAFYRAQGYGHAATLREFYQAGEDKIVFSKHLRAAASAYA